MKIFLVVLLAVCSCRYAYAQTFIDSNLPVLSIRVNGAAINDEPKTPGYLWVVNKSAGQRNKLGDTTTAQLKCRIGIQVRGNTSQNNPKKSYVFETRKANDSNLDVALLGMPAESDWVLYASYQDKTLMRDPFTYWLAQKMGRYSSRARFVELFVDNEYVGVYVLEERIKRGTYRVPVTKLETTDLTGNKLTGGYIVRIDPPNGGERFGSNYTNTCRDTLTTTQFEIVYPKSTDLQPAQSAYIQQYVHDFEAALQSDQYTDPVNGYARYADVNSLVDYMLLTEMTKNADAYMVSVYFYKDRDSKGGKLTMGPFWDYNYAWGNGFYCGQPYATGWAWSEGVVCDVPGSVPFWWERLLRDQTFVTKLQSRYRQLRQTVFANTAMLAYVDSSAALLSESQVRNFQRWPVLELNDIPFAAHGATYEGEVSHFKGWIQNRMAFMDASIDQIGLSVSPGPTQRICPPITEQVLTTQLGRNTTYQWVIDRDTTSLSSQQNQFIATRSGTYKALLTLAGNMGCQLTTQPSTLTFITTNTLPVTSSLSLTANSSNVPTLILAAGGPVATYTWTGPGQFTATGPTISRSPATAQTDGRYYVRAMGPEGCAVLDSIWVDYKAEMADLSVSAQSSRRIMGVAETVQVDVTVANEGPADATDVLVQNRLPDNLRFVGGEATSTGGVVLSPSLTILAGQTQTFSYTVQPNADAVFINTLEITSARRIDPDSRLGSGTGDGEDDAATVDFRTPNGGVIYRSPNPNQLPLATVQSNQPPPDPAKADLSIRMHTSRNTMVIGDTITVSVNLTNGGGLIATGTSVRVDLPTGLSYVPGSGGTAAGQAVTLFWPSVAVQTTTQLSFKTRFTTVGAPLLIAAEVVGASQPDPDSQPNTGTADGQDDCARVLLGGGQ